MTNEDRCIIISTSKFLIHVGAKGGNKQLTQLLNYIVESKEENAVSEELKELHRYVTRIKRRKEVGVRYMKSWELEKMWRKEAREEGREEGRKEGIGQGRVDTLQEMILLVLAQKGDICDEMMEKIQQQKEMDVLERWLHVVLETDMLEEIKEKLCDTVH